VRRLFLLLVWAIGLSATTANAQSPEVARLRVSVGTVLDFHLQTRLKASVGDALDALPKGTVLHVKMLDSLDSMVNRDGFPFHGMLTLPVESGDQIVVHSGAEVHGLLALLRSATHPEGFRYDLLVTGLVDHGQDYTLTAFLAPGLSGDISKSKSISAAPQSDPVLAKQPPPSGSFEVAPD
jgi:hypothetical protein